MTGTAGTGLTVKGFAVVVTILGATVVVVMVVTILGATVVVGATGLTILGATGFTILGATGFAVFAGAKLYP